MLEYKVWQNGLQSALGITKCGRVDYKVRQGLQSELSTARTTKLNGQES